MDTTEYLQALRQRLAPYYDFKPANTEKLAFELIAECNHAEEAYFLAKSIKLYGINNNEYIYLHALPNALDANTWEKYCTYIINKIRNLQPNKEHMSSIFHLVFLISYPLDRGLHPTINKFKFHKDHSFTLKGWSDLSIIIVELPNQVITTNKLGAKSIKNFQL